MTRMPLQYPAPFSLRISKPVQFSSMAAEAYMKSSQIPSKNAVQKLENYPVPLSSPPPPISKNLELNRALTASSKSSLFSLERKDVLFEDEWLIAMNKPQGIYCESILSSAHNLLNSDRGRSARPAPRPAPARSPPPQKVNNATPPANVQGGSGGSILGGIGSTIAQGMAFGTGSAVAHRVVDAVMGPRTIQHETVGSEATAAPAAMGGSDACGMHYKAFQDCLNTSGNDISKCQFYMDILSDCRRSSGSMMSS